MTTQTTLTPMNTVAPIPIPTTTATATPTKSGPTQEATSPAKSQSTPAATGPNEPLRSESAGTPSKPQSKANLVPLDRVIPFPLACPPARRIIDDRQNGVDVGFM